MRVRPSALLACGACLCAALAGCGPTRGAEPAQPSPPPAPASPTPSAEAVRWMDGFCGTVRTFFVSLRDLNTPTSGNTLESIKRGTSKQLGQYATLAGAAADGLRALPPGPDEIGEAARRSFAEKYASARDKVAGAKARLDASAPDDSDAQNRAVEVFGAALKDVEGAADPIEAVAGSATLKAASATAARCKPGSG